MGLERWQGGSKTGRPLIRCPVASAGVSSPDLPASSSPWRPAWRPAFSRRWARRGRLTARVARLGVAVVLLGMVAPRVGASSPAAWQAYDQEVRSACLKASRLLQPRLLGERIDVPVADVSPTQNTLLISTVLLEGRYRQPHMRGQKGRELCLFEQRTRQASVADADFIDRPRPKP